MLRSAVSKAAERPGFFVWWVIRDCNRSRVLECLMVREKCWIHSALFVYLNLTGRTLISHESEPHSAGFMSEHTGRALLRSTHLGPQQHWVLIFLSFAKTVDIITFQLCNMVLQFYELIYRRFMTANEKSVKYLAGPTQSRIPRCPDTQQGNPAPETQYNLINMSCSVAVSCCLNLITFMNSSLQLCCSSQCMRWRSTVVRTNDIPRIYNLIAKDDQHSLCEKANFYT